MFGEALFSYENWKQRCPPTGKRVTVAHSQDGALSSSDKAQTHPLGLDDMNLTSETGESPEATQHTVGKAPTDRDGQSPGAWGRGDAGEGDTEQAERGISLG